MTKKHRLDTIIPRIKGIDPDSLLKAAIEVNPKKSSRDKTGPISGVKAGDPRSNSNRSDRWVCKRNNPNKMIQNA